MRSINTFTGCIAYFNKKSNGLFFCFLLFIPVFSLIVSGCGRKPKAPEKKISEEKNFSRHLTPSSVNTQTVAKQNIAVKEYLEGLPVCSDRGLLSKEECAACQNDKNSVCAVSLKLSDGVQCYECMTKPKTCADYKKIRLKVSQFTIKAFILQ